MIFHPFYWAFSLQRSVIKLDHRWRIESPWVFCHLGHVQTLGLHWIMKVEFLIPTSKIGMTIFAPYIHSLKHAATYRSSQIGGGRCQLLILLQYWSKTTHHLIEVLCQQENAKKVRKHSVSFTESPWKPAVLWRKIYMFQVPEKISFVLVWLQGLLNRPVLEGVYASSSLSEPSWSMPKSANLYQQVQVARAYSSQTEYYASGKRWKADRSEPSSLGLGILRLRISLMEWNFNF